jgi:hypothetical protein
MLTSTYIPRTQALVSDLNASFWSVPLLTNYINEARGQIAARGQCIRILPPSTNGIVSITVLTGGHYGSTPTVVITGPGSGATATANMSGTAVNTITVNTPGSGYDNTTVISFTGGAPVTSAATASPVINCLNTVAGQEVYTFANANALAQLTSGVQSILFVESVAVSWGALKPVLSQWNFNDLQAYVRAYPVQNNQPSIWAQLSQGQSGSVYLQPVPVQPAAMDWVCICTPINLVLDSDPEAIPYPWTDIVPYWAASLAFMNARRKDEASNMMQIVDRMMLSARASSEPSLVPDYYDG